MLSKRVSKSKSSPNLLHSAWYKQHSNPYNSEDNPDGIINLGTSENRLLADVIQKKLATINMGDIPEEYTHYCKLSGTDQFRDKLCSFLGDHLKPVNKLKRDDIYVMNGCGTVVESIGYALCDEGDGILIPAPYYCGFKSDLEQRIGVKVFPVHLKSNGEDTPFPLTTADLEEAFLRAEHEGVPIKALLLSNPNNPLGTIYTEEELMSYIEFCDSYNIHLICDEIYMLSVYDEDIQFKSVLALDRISKYEDKVHVVWGFSKDFGLSGFRCGAAITRNPDLQSALTSMGYYTSVPTATQYILEELITDNVWLNEMISINHSRLRASRDLVTKELAKNNIPCVYPTSGLFVWMDLSNFLSTNSKQSEIHMFNTLMDKGVYLVPGFAFECNEHGWFRIIISHNIELLEVALIRIKDIVMQNEHVKINMKRHRTDENFSRICAKKMRRH